MQHFCLKCVPERLKCTTEPKKVHTPYTLRARSSRFPQPPITSLFNSQDNLGACLSHCVWQRLYSVFMAQRGMGGMNLKKASVTLGMAPEPTLFTHTPGLILAMFARCLFYLTGPCTVHMNFCEFHRIHFIFIARLAGMIIG